VTAQCLLIVDKRTCADRARKSASDPSGHRVDRVAIAEPRVIPNASPWRDLLGLDVGRLDDRPPFLNLGLVVGAERGWRLLLGRKSVMPKFFEPRPHRWIS